MRIVAATTVTGPYIVARYRRFAETHPECELTLLEFGRVSEEYAWLPSDVAVPYRRLVLSEAPIQRLGSWRRLRLIQDALEALHPDVLVVCGYGVTGMGAALHWARTQDRAVPVVMLSDSTAADQARMRWKEWIKSRVVHQCGSALVAGRRHREYMSMLGMPDRRIFEGYDVVDNAHFAHGAEQSRNMGRPDGVPERSFFLASSRFIPKKNLGRLLAAFDLYRRAAGPACWDLVLLGDGNLRQQIEAQITSLSLSEAVHLPGFKQYGDISAYYAEAGAFVHASTTEQWGLVVNEAMASGLPVLVSQRCGCAPDLVANDRNGYTFDPFDVNALAELMTTVASDDCDRAAMGQASREIIDRWTPDTFARGLGDAVDAALAAPLPKMGLVDSALLWALSHR